MQGRSFAACLADPAAQPAHETLWWCHEGNRAVRAGDWKLVAKRGGSWELYDLAADRCETTNLAEREPARVTQLERKWERIAADCRKIAGAESAVGGAAAARRPNIIYVMTDDQGYGDIAALGNPVLATPDLVNENVDGPAENPFKTTYEKQFGSRRPAGTGNTVQSR
jgi:arylsulfatase A-like enzyme